jgi:hypothetical protein
MYMTQRGVAFESAAKTRIGSLLVSRSPLLEVPATAVGRRP